MSKGQLASMRAAMHTTGASTTCLRLVISILLVSVITALALTPHAAADDRSGPDGKSSSTDDKNCGYHASDAGHTHIEPDVTKDADCADVKHASYVPEGEEGAKYIGKLLSTELGRLIERFARWAAVALIIYSVVWMIWPLFQSSRGGGGEQRKVFKNLVLPLVVAAIAFDLDVSGGILDFFIRVVRAAGSTFTELLG